MNTLHCCQIQPHPGDHADRSRSWLHRARDIAGWFIPGAVLALLPKCPVCVAAYVALGTGFMMTPTSAQHLLRAVSALCIGTIAYCLARRMVSYYRPRPTASVQPSIHHIQ